MLAPGVLACGSCHALVHGEELERLSTTARDLEAKEQLRAAREQWLACLPLLPWDSKQAEWIRDHIAALDARADTAGVLRTEPGSTEPWRRKLTPIATLLLFIAVYSAAEGPRFGLGFALLVFIHEMGHFIDIKRRGLPADMPVFLPGLGAYVRWRALGVSLETRAAVSLAGPAAGLIAAFVCWVVWLKTGEGMWAVLARASAWMNILNLVPVWILDGGQAALALSKVERIVLLVVSLGLLAAVQEMVFLVVAGGALFRVFTKDQSARPSPRITIYFVAVLVLLAVVMRFVPTQASGM
jgi:Zn-dependent protease